MNEGIEIYIRSCGDGKTLLNFYFPNERREELITQLMSGKIESSNIPIHFECSVLPEWATDMGDKKSISNAGAGIHCRIPIASINL